MLLSTALKRVAVASGCLAAGCTSLRPVPPAEYLTKNSPDLVWVTYPNRVVVPVAQPEVAGDTLKGMRPGTSQPVAIPLAQVSSVQAKTPDGTKTIFFATALGAGAVSAVYLIWISQAGPRTDGVYCPYDVRGRVESYC